VIPYFTRNFNYIRKGYYSSILIFLCCTTDLMSQRFPFDFWHDGKVVTEDGDTLRGKIKYDPQNDLIQIGIGTRYESFTPRKVLYYDLVDATTKTFRKFYALPYAVSGDYRTPVFFELLTEGKYTLLCREALEQVNVNSFYYYGGGSRVILVYRYYLLKENGSILQIGRDKDDLMNLMQDRRDEIRKYIRSNHLNLDRRPDLVRAILYYNSLFPNEK
jgi:hypothetical protein